VNVSLQPASGRHLPWPGRIGRPGRMPVRRGGRVVDGGGLENRWAKASWVRIPPSPPVTSRSDRGHSPVTRLSNPPGWTATRRRSAALRAAVGRSSRIRRVTNAWRKSWTRGVARPIGRADDEAALTRHADRGAARSISRTSSRRPTIPARRADGPRPVADVAPAARRGHRRRAARPAGTGVSSDRQTGRDRRRHRTSAEREPAARFEVDVFPRQRERLAEPEPRPEQRPEERPLRRRPRTASTIAWRAPVRPTAQGLSRARGSAPEHASRTPVASCGARTSSRSTSVRWGGDERRVTDAKWE
jgi:hypothetical protein